MTQHLTPEEARVIQQRARHFSEQGWGLALGSLLGLGLFVATNVLVIRGGPDAGPHLGLLQIFFPGYRVTFLGSLVGFAYAFVLGHGIGWTIAAVWTRLNRIS